MEIKQPSKVSRNTHLLTPLPPQELKLGKHVFFDIETGLPGENTLGGSWVIGQARFYDNPSTAYNFNDEAEFLDFCLSKKMRGHTVVAHNGSGYDYAYLMKHIRDYKDEHPGLKYDMIIRGDGRPILITLRYKKQIVKLIDSFTVIQTSLSALTKVLAPLYAKKERPWELPDGSVNYFHPNNPLDMEYLNYDVLGLMFAYEKYCQIVFEHFGVNLALTSASTAMKAWRRTLPDDMSGYFWRQRPAVEEYGRKSYAGGIVFLTTITPQYDMLHLDVNAMYAHAMRQGVPIGSGCFTDVYRAGKAGIYHCVAHVPLDEMYPFIPDLNNRWSCGNFECYIPSITIEYARSLGYIIDVIDGYTFDSIGMIFDDFLTTCEKLEREHKIDGIVDSIGMAAKNMRNSLYGKFGMKPVAKKLIFGEVPANATPFFGPDDNIPSDCLYEKIDDIQAPYMMVHWASWVTAHARIHLNTLARATSAVYGDTDSIVISRTALAPVVAAGVLKIGEAYGELKVEAEYVKFVAMGPKRYSATKHDASHIDKAKGIPKAGLRHEDNFTGTTKIVPYVSVNSIPSLLKFKTQNMTTRRTRQYSKIEHSKTWSVFPNGDVRPRVSDHQNK